jgi:hypothetical protein
MKVASSANRQSRTAAKRASRRQDCRRLANGESPTVVQRENSIFPSDFFKKAKISNFSDAVGR